MMVARMAAHIVPDPPYVLLVEADRLLRDSVGEVLHASGFVPLLATDAADALRYLAGASAPVLIILDLDSLAEPAEMLARLRADARWSRVPVVVTGSAAELPGALHVDGELPKPFDAERLVSLGRELIARPR
jgi:DNA-binding response OmpR family regulator